MVKFTPLGGINEVTKNMFLYETKDSVLIVDCGAGFPEEELEENQILIPDFSYLRTNRKRILGVVVSHAHFDHYGAIPYLLAEFDLPVFGSRLTLEFVKEKMRQIKLRRKQNFKVLDPKRKLSLGDFKITPFLVNHSVPDSFGLCLETPAGNVFHVSDFKFDLTPISGEVFDFATCLKLAEAGVLALFSDCLGASEEGFTQTEKGIGEVLYRLINQAQGQVFVTTLSSNIYRIQQVMGAAKKLNRPVVPLGQSMATSMKIASQLGYLKSGLVKADRSRPRKRLLYLVSGSYGQTNSALMRIAQDNHPEVKLEKEATVIFSADPSPPNTKSKVDKLVDLLTLKGARVHYYEIQENLHASGHGSADDIKLLMALVRPKFLIPIGGCPRHMRAYSLLASQMGVDRKRVFELLPGQSLILSPHQVQLGPRLKLKQRLVLV